MEGKQTGEAITRLVGLMQRLLAPDGCPWDREQTLDTLIPYLIEETFEVVDAVQGGDPADHLEELGDLLLQVVFQAELRHREGRFGIDDVARGIVDKLVRRHPHVFGEVKAQSADEALKSWSKLKAVEKAGKGKKGTLEGIPRSAPALIRASRTGEKAATVGFDWADAAGARAKVTEELGELDEAIASGDREQIVAELGDTLFALTSLARKLGVDPESALRATTERFGRRFAHMEAAAEGAGKTLREFDPEAQDQLWRAAKAAGL
jgi:tetrapyrrole methylase family protein/MazG family protein/ATP diphosphatase